MRDAHQYAAGWWRGHWHVLQFQPSVLILGDLFHDEARLLERFSNCRRKLELAKARSKIKAESVVFRPRFRHKVQSRRPIGAGMRVQFLG
jgi:hypothetical protein